MGTPWAEWYESVESLLKEKGVGVEPVRSWWRARFFCNYTPEAAVYEWKTLLEAGNAEDVSVPPVREDYDAFCAKCGNRTARLGNALDTTAAFVETILEVACFNCGALQPVRFIPNSETPNGNPV